MSNYSKIEKASFTTLLMGFALMFYGFYKGAELEMGAQKENYLVLIIFSMVVVLFSLFSYFTNPSK